MNWLLIVVILIIAWNMVSGYMKGFLRVVYSLAAGVLAISISTAVTPYVKETLEKNTQIEVTIRENVKENIRDKVESESAVKKEQAGESIDDILNQYSENELFKEFGIELPKPAIDKLLDQSADAATGALTESGIYDEIAAQIASLAMDGIAFVITIAIVGIIFMIISQLLKIVDKIPILNGVNKGLGVAAGLIKGIIIIWIFMAIITLCCGSGAGKMMIGYIRESGLLRILYENNLILQTIMLFF